MRPGESTSPGPDKKKPNESRKTEQRSYGAAPQSGLQPPSDVGEAGEDLSVEGGSQRRCLDPGPLRLKADAAAGR